MKATKFEELIGKRHRNLQLMFIIILILQKTSVSEIRLQGLLLLYQIILQKDLSETATKNLSDFLILQEVHAVK
jgi:hypothetical protein